MSRAAGSLARPRSFLGPVLSAALLAVSPSLLFPGDLPVEDRVRTEVIAARFDAVPARIGGWIGVEAPVPTDAREILRPNAILSRRFTRIGGGEALTLALVHCSDVRDMDGHYPPVCYAQAGWSIDEASTLRLPLAVPSLGALEVTAYAFRRIRSDGQRETMTVLNGFILPGGGSAPDMAPMREIVRDRRVSARGVAQLQVLFQPAIPPERAAELAAEVLAGLPSGLMETLADRAGKESNDG